MEYVSATYKFTIESAVSGNKEARRLHIHIKAAGLRFDCYFDADDFISCYNENPPTGFMKDTSLAIWKMGNDYVQEHLGNYLNDKKLTFPITVIFQIILFVVMELYRNWRNKKKYEELEKFFHDITNTSFVTTTTYNDNEYCRCGEVEWCQD